MENGIYRSVNKSTVKEYYNRFSRRLHRSFYRSPARSGNSEKRSWNEKAARNAEIERPVLRKKIASIVVLGICFLMTLTEQHWKLQAACYLAALGIFLGMDPLNMMNRFLAPQSRSILVLLSIIGMIAVIHPEKTFILIAGLVIASGLFAIKIMNISWLATYNWVMSAEVQKTLRIDPEHTSVLAWQAHGKRETRTMLYELGYNTDDDILDVLHRPVYLCGYLHGFKKTINCEKQLQEVQEMAGQIEKYKKQCEDLQKIDQERAAELLEINKRISTAEEQVDYWRKLYKKEKELNEKIIAVNDELVNTIPDPGELLEQREQVTQIKEQSLEERVLEALDAGMSYAEAGKFAGCSKTTAWNIGKRINGKNEKAG